MKGSQMLGKSRTHKMPFLVVWLLSIFGALSVVPYVRYLGILPSSFSLESMLFITALQAMLFSGLLCYLSFLLISRTDLAPFSLRPF